MICLVRIEKDWFQELRLQSKTLKKQDIAFMLMFLSLIPKISENLRQLQIRSMT